MSAVIPQPSSCCSKCGNEIVSQVPGPIGPAGAAGTNGTNGVNAFTKTTASFVMPAIGLGDVVVPVVTSAWMAIGQVLYLKDPGSLNAGYFLIDGIPTSTSVSLVNLGYPGNAVAGATFGNTTAVVAGGLEGPAIVGTVPIDQGGTGQITATSAMNALSPTTTKGDLIVDNGTNSPGASDVRMAVGPNGNVLTAFSAVPTGMAWLAIDLTGANTNFSGALPIAHGGSGQATKTAAFDALSPLTTAGDIIYRNGSNNVRLGLGTAGQQLRVNAGATAPEWANNVNTVLQVVTNSVITKTTVTTVVPFDDTIPDGASEGTSMFTLTITPTTNTSRLAVKVLMNFGMSGSVTDDVAMFLTVTGSTSAVATVDKKVFQDTMSQLELFYIFVPGVTSPITLTVFLGPATNTSTLTMNGENNNRKFGGTMISYIEAVEYA